MCFSGWNGPRLKHILYPPELKPCFKFLKNTSTSKPWAEELTLKTNEITRRKSDFLEGTYALHGIEEVMEDGDIVFVVEPIQSEYEKYQKVFGGANVHVVAIDTKPTPFTTIVVPEAGDLQAYVYLAAGWNTLVEIAQADGINLDKPNRARKVGNEM